MCGIALRKQKGLSQEQLAEKIGVSRQAVSKLERSEASPDTDNLILLARLYEISLDELLKTDDEIPAPKEAEQGGEAEEKDSPADEQPQEISAENAAEEKAKKIGIAARASQMTDMHRIKLIAIVAAALIVLWYRFSLDAFWVAVFSVELFFSIIDAVHFRDIGKFKMWALSILGVSFYMFESWMTRRIALVLILTPLYEIILWFIRRKRKK